MPLLSEVLAATANPSVIHGLIVDVDDVTPPAGVTEVGLVSTLPEGNLEEIVLDIAISYILAGMSVVIEIPADVAVPDPKHLVSTAASIGASLSILPPEGADDVGVAAYIDRVEAFAVAYTKQANFAKMLIPVTSYLQYLFVEVLDPALAKEFSPTDPYIISRYVDRIAPDHVDTMKDRIKSVFHGAYGGPEGFSELGRTLFREIFERLEEGLLDQISEASNQTPPPAA